MYVVRNWIGVLNLSISVLIILCIIDHLFGFRGRTLVRWGKKDLFMDFCYGWVCLHPTVCLWNLKHANIVLNTLTLATFTIKVLYIVY